MASAPPPPAAAGKELVRCPSCNATNPRNYKFCVTCGTPITTESATGSAVKESPNGSASTTESAPADKKSSAPAAAAVEAPIVGAPVLEIVAATAPATRGVTCLRCRGVCEAGTRFCKFCGAGIGEGGPGQTAPDPAVMRAAALLEDNADEPTTRLDTRAIREAIQGSSPADLGAKTSSPSNARAVTDPSREQKPPGEVRLLPFTNDEANSHRAPIELRPKPPRGDPQPAIWARRMLPPSELDSARDRRAEPTPRELSTKNGGGRLVVIVEDGSEGRSFSLAEGHLDIGRTEGDILLEDDPYVSPRHARLRRMPSSWYVQDLESTNRVYLRMRKPYALRDGDLLLLGLEVLQFQTVNDGERGLGHAIQHGTFVFGSPATPRRARLCQKTVEGVTRDVYHLFRDETTIGRESGDVVFTADPFLSRRHASIRRNPVTSEFALVDLDSSNGTYVAIRGEVPISDGDYLRIGQHLFRVDLS